VSVFALLQRTYRSFIEGFFYYLGAAVGLVWINESQSKVGDIGANIFMVTLIWMVAKGKLNETFFKWHYIRPFIIRGVVASISPVIVVYVCTGFFTWRFIRMYRRDALLIKNYFYHQQLLVEH